MAAPQSCCQKLCLGCRSGRPHTTMARLAAPASCWRGVPASVCPAFPACPSRKIPKGGCLPHWAPSSPLPAFSLRLRRGSLRPFYTCARFCARGWLHNTAFCCLPFSFYYTRGEEVCQSGRKKRERRRRIVVFLPPLWYYYGERAGHRSCHPQHCGKEFLCRKR